MIIKKIDIENFGKFSGKLVEFRPGFNIIFGNNEDGKSTLMSFIKLMFYGNSSSKSSDVSKNLRKKYLPWNGSPMSGSIEFESNGQSFRLHKDFKKTSSTDKTTVSNIDTGEKVTLPSNCEIGEEFFNMTSGEFERSVFIEEFGGFSSESAGDSLAMRISNLTVSGDEGFSQNLVVDRISKAREELISKSQKKGLLIEAQTKLEKLSYDLDVLNEQTSAQYALMSDISALKNEISELEAELDIISNNQKIANAKKELKLFSNLSECFNQKKAVLTHLEKFQLTPSLLADLTKQCNTLKSQISETLTTSAESDSAVVSDSEYLRCAEIAEKRQKLESDLIHINTTVLSAEKTLKNQIKAERKKSLTLSVLFPTIASILGLGCFLFLPKFNAIGILPLVLGAFVFWWMRRNAEQKTNNSLSVRIARQEYENSLRLLSFYDANTLGKTVYELVSLVDNKKAEYDEFIGQKLSYYSCSSLEELQEKTVSAGNSRFANSAGAVLQLKQQFIDLVSKAKTVETFEQALTTFNEIETTLSELSAVERDISTISSTTSSETISHDFVLSKIDELSQFIDSLSVDNTVTEKKPNEIKFLLKGKRDLLGDLQSRIKLPEVSENQLLSQISEAKDAINDFSERYDCLSIVSEVMDAAISEMNRGLGSHLSQKTAEYLSQMSGGKHSDVMVSRDLSIETRGALSESYHEWKHLSSGAIDRVYLALRLATTDIIAEKGNPLPLFLDDILTQYDDENCKNTLMFLKKYLEEYASTTQILFFTCHNHIAKMAREILKDINEITLQEGMTE